MNDEILIINEYPMYQRIWASQGKAYIECQEISFNRGGTVIQKQGIPEL